MIEINRKNTERAILVALNTRELNREIIEEHLNELEELALTAGAETIYKITQDRNTADSAFYIGKGKAEQLAGPFVKLMKLTWLFLMMTSLPYRQEILKNCSTGK